MNDRLIQLNSNLGDLYYPYSLVPSPQIYSNSDLVINTLKTESPPTSVGGCTCDLALIMKSDAPATLPWLSRSEVLKIGKKGVFFFQRRNSLILTSYITSITFDRTPCERECGRSGHGWVTDRDQIKWTFLNSINKLPLWINKDCVNDGEIENSWSSEWYLCIIYTIQITVSDIFTACWYEWVCVYVGIYHNKGRCLFFHASCYCVWGVSMCHDK
jgi:hypothetical protein